MGLAGQRNRRKLDHDPNNTKWTRDETTFGQKILRAHGWEPGKFLGAQGTVHAQSHSAASLAPIKINLKDDNLGLGAKIRQKQSDECTGLDVFKDLLGRLNGKSEEVLEKERYVRAVIKTNLFVERKYGPMRFVSGGLLVGDQMQMAELVENKSATTSTKDESASEAPEAECAKREKKEKRQKKSKKRKASESEEVDSSEGKREKKRKKRLEVNEDQGDDDTRVGDVSKKKIDKKEKKSKRSEKGSDAAESEVKPKKSKKTKDLGPQDSPSKSQVEAPEDIAPEKAKKKEKKKKDKKQKRTDSIEASAVTTTISSSTTPHDSGSSTPSNTGTSTPVPTALSARHRSRARHIASKKLAFSDMQALNQIFMIKPV
ncbi:putative g-patch domain-containing protein [Rosellinia necatrix]|uniref:PinX1-related protein 1 n=1 Tax=Rosellinia necatrix TaxID=77044 RepID=A0A1S7UJF0_ROSNE|nr:putative g-patch domain-containing protein [Rosellinia necatrix]